MNYLILRDLTVLRANMRQSEWLLSPLLIYSAHQMGVHFSIKNHLTENYRGVFYLHQNYEKYCDTVGGIERNIITKVTCGATLKISIKNSPASFPTHPQVFGNLKCSLVFAFENDISNLSKTQIEHFFREARLNGGNVKLKNGNILVTNAPDEVIRELPSGYLTNDISHLIKNQNGRNMMEKIFNFRSDLHPHSAPANLGYVSVEPPTAKRGVRLASHPRDMMPLHAFCESAVGVVALNTKREIAPSDLTKYLWVDSFTEFPDKTFHHKIQTHEN